MRFEVARARGHHGFPPHFHLMLWVPRCVGSEIPHFYMDARADRAERVQHRRPRPARTIEDRRALVMEKKKRKGEYGPGRP